jgi:hypothetical protein
MCALGKCAFEKPRPSGKPECIDENGFDGSLQRMGTHDQLILVLRCNTGLREILRESQSQRSQAELWIYTPFLRQTPSTTCIRNWHSYNFDKANLRTATCRARLVLHALDMRWTCASHVFLILLLGKRSTILFFKHIAFFYCFIKV